MATSQQAAAPEKKKERPSALRSIIAGSTAGAVEIGMFLVPAHSLARVLLTLDSSYYLSCRMYVPAIEYLLVILSCHPLTSCIGPREGGVGKSTEDHTDGILA